MGGERDQDISEAATGVRNDPAIISMFRHPLGNPSNPDLSPRALGCIHVRIFFSRSRVSVEFYTG